MSNKPRVGEQVDVFEIETLSGNGPIKIGATKDRWTMLVVYRGRHCPRCKRYLNKLNDMLSKWTDVMDVVVVSADTKEKAIADRDEFGWDFELGYGLTVDRIRKLGLYVSEPLSEAETTDMFSEPGTFAIRPDGSLMLVDISNGPAARPDLDELLDGMIFNINNDRPVRGTA
ncbi:MAG: redoxin domain-containing protein [Lentilitoribacter sp.]